MPDRLLIVAFSSLTLLSLGLGGMCLYFAVQHANKKDGELKMAFWSFGALAGLVVAGLSVAYFLLPIFIKRVLGW